MTDFPTKTLLSQMDDTHIRHHVIVPKSSWDEICRRLRDNDARLVWIIDRMWPPKTFGNQLGIVPGPETSADLIAAIDAAMAVKP